MGKGPKVRSNLGHGSLFMESSQLLLYFRLQIRFVLNTCVRKILKVCQQHDASLLGRKHHHKTEQPKFTRTPSTIKLYFWAWLQYSMNRFCKYWLGFFFRKERKPFCASLNYIKCSQTRMILQVYSFLSGWGIMGNVLELRFVCNIKRNVIRGKWHTVLMTSVCSTSAIFWR